MNQKDLHEVIANILRSTEKPLSIKQIANTINKNKSWYRPKDGKLPQASQISARVSKHPDLFLRTNGEVSLIINKSIEKKITRLTYNDRGWVEPSGWERKSRTPGLHESEFGFGHEEWLFDFNRIIRGFKYGFIEGLRTINNKHGGKTYDLQLFAIDSIEKQKYWIASINNCYVLTEEEQFKMQDEFILKGWVKENEDQLKELGLWNKGSQRSINEFAPNVRFTKKDVTFVDPPIPIPYSKFIQNRDRYLLYDWNEDALIGLGDTDEFTFKASTPNSNKKVWRRNLPEFKSKEIKQLHRQISESLYKILSNEYGVKNIGCDLPNNSGTYIDIVRKDGNQYVFYEIKTYNQLRKNIRESLGQLLEYAFWKRNKQIKELVIVSDKKLDSGAKEYLSFLKYSFKIPISYLQQNIV